MSGLKWTERPSKSSLMLGLHHKRPRFCVSVSNERQLTAFLSSSIYLWRGSSYCHSQKLPLCTISPPVPATSSRTSKASLTLLPHGCVKAAWVFPACFLQAKHNSQQNSLKTFVSLMQNLTFPVSNGGLICSELSDPASPPPPRLTPEGHSGFLGRTSGD